MTKINGEGFSKEDLAGDELAQHREMFREFEKLPRDKITEIAKLPVKPLEDLVESAPVLVPLAGLGSSAKVLVFVFAIVSALFLGIKVLVTQGFFG